MNVCFFKPKFFLEKSYFWIYHLLEEIIFVLKLCHIAFFLVFVFYITSFSSRLILKFSNGFESWQISHDVLKTHRGFRGKTWEASFWLCASTLLQIASTLILNYRVLLFFFFSCISTHSSPFLCSYLPLLILLLLRNHCLLFFPSTLSTWLLSWKEKVLFGELSVFSGGK